MGLLQNHMQLTVFSARKTMKLSLLYTIIASLSQLILLELECIFLQTKTTKRRQ